MKFICINKDASFVKKKSDHRIILKPAITEKKCSIFDFYFRSFSISAELITLISVNVSTIELIFNKCLHDVHTKYFRKIRKLVTDIPIFSWKDE